MQYKLLVPHHLHGHERRLQQGARGGVEALPEQFIGARRHGIELKTAAFRGGAAHLRDQSHGNSDARVRVEVRSERA